MQLTSPPLITIVTICYNSVDTISATIDSVVNQNYPDVQYIVIDGGSTDGTLQLIKSYDGYIDSVISERDLGIYDAMNKSLPLAQGAWLLFMNSGDVFSDNGVLSRIFSNCIYNRSDILYGDVIVRYSNQKFLHKRAPRALNLDLGSRFSHQSAFIPVGYHKENSYDISAGIAADFKFFYFAKSSGIKFVYLNSIVAVIEAGGVSDNKRIRSLISMYNAVTEKKISVYLYFSYRIAMEIFKGFIKRILRFFNGI